MTAYILAVCGASLIAALVAILLPEGRTGKFVNGILKLFCLLVMLVPLLFLFSEQDWSISSDGGSEEMELDDGFIDYMFSRRAEEEEAAIEALVLEEFSVQADAQVLWESVEYAYTVTKIGITVEEGGISGDDGHIFIIEKIAARISDLYEDAEVTVQ